MAVFAIPLSACSLPSGVSTPQRSAYVPGSSRTVAFDSPPPGRGAFETVFPAYRQAPGNIVSPTAVAISSRLTPW